MNPERFYPGDKYVDVIGVSEYEWKHLSGSKKSFAGLLGSTYQQMITDHPDKRFIVAESGFLRKKSQAKKISETLDFITGQSRIKAYNYWNSASPKLKTDHTLTKDSLDVFK